MRAAAQGQQRKGSGTEAGVRSRPLAAEVARHGSLAFARTVLWLGAGPLFAGTVLWLGASPASAEDTLRPAPGGAFLLDAGQDAQASSVNTSFDEREPALSRDGRLLLFSSDRTGIYRVYAAYLAQPLPGPAEPLRPLDWIPPPGGGRPLPELPWLGGPGSQRSPCLCERAPGAAGRYELRLFFRGEAEWGAGIYQVDALATAVPGSPAAAPGRLVLTTAAVRPLLQGIGLRLEGPWLLPEGSWAGAGDLLLARSGGAFRAWSLRHCEAQPVDPEALAEALPELRELSEAESLAWAAKGRLLVSRPGVRGRLDFQWHPPGGPPLGRSLAGNTLNTDGWDEMEASFGPRRDGQRLLIFSRETNPTRRDSDLFWTWLPLE